MPKPPSADAQDRQDLQDSQDSQDRDIVLWGATGFTGRLVAEYLVGHPDVIRGGVTLALAGRDREKLEALRAELAAREGAPAATRELPLFVADALDAESLRPMVRRARVVCTTVGPYGRYGTPLARLCAELGTDSCDLSGEVPWMRRTIDELHEPALASGARIVHCCGFDSIPSDLGVFLAHRRLADEGRSLHRARLRVRSIRGKLSGGTVASMFEILAEAKTDRSVRRLLANPYALAPKRAPKRAPERAAESAPKREGAAPRPRDSRDQSGAALDPDRGVWTAPFLMSGINTRIVRRSNALLGFPYGRDFAYDEAVDTGRGLRGRLRATTVATALRAFTGAAVLPPTAWLLRSFVLPAPGEGPSAEERESGGFRITLFGESDGEPTLRVRTRIAADRDPGYGATAQMLGEAALCLARGEAEGLPGGVLTPASALGMPLVRRLRTAGFTFESEIVDE